MTDLDDRASLESIDRAAMRALLIDFPDQVARAWEWEAEVPSIDDMDQIVVCGMGGSAIGGDLLATLVRQWDVPMPVATVRDYALPTWVDPRTLVVAISYSGNTEETLSCARQALDRGCPLLAVTSGGELAEIARSSDGPVISVPSGQPPRASLGYLLFPVLRSLARWIDRDMAAEVDSAIRTMRALVGELDEAPEEANRAKRLARDLQDHVPVIYASAGLTEAVGRRWKTQINENAKSPAYWDVIPELNHNEIMGWEGDDLASRFVYVLLRDPYEQPPVVRRFDVSRQLLQDRGYLVRDVQGPDESSLLARLMGYIVLGDWVSYYGAMLRGVDPTPVGLIESFKQRMAEA